MDLQPNSHSKSWLYSHEICLPGLTFIVSWCPTAPGVLKVPHMMVQEKLIGGEAGSNNMSAACFMFSLFQGGRKRGFLIGEIVRLSPSRFKATWIFIQERSIFLPFAYTEKIQSWAVKIFPWKLLNVKLKFFRLTQYHNTTIPWPELSLCNFFGSPEEVCQTQQVFKIWWKITSWFVYI